MFGCLSALLIFRYLTCFHVKKCIHSIQWKGHIIYWFFFCHSDTIIISLYSKKKVFSLYLVYWKSFSFSIFFLYSSLNVNVSLYILARTSLHTWNELLTDTVIMFHLKTMWCPLSGLCYCVFSMDVRLWRVTPTILCGEDQQSMWYLPKACCQKAINRFKGHPPAPQLQTLPTTYTLFSQLSTDGCTFSLGMAAKRAVGSEPWWNNSQGREDASSIKATKLALYQNYKELINRNV